MKHFLRILLLISFPLYLHAQENIDSLHKNLLKAADAEQQYAAVKYIYNYYEERNRDSALYYAEKGETIARNSHHQLAEAYCAVMKSYQLMSMGRLAESLQILLNVFPVAEDPKNEKEQNWNLSGLNFKGNNRLLLLSLTHHMFALLMLRTGNIEQQIIHFKEAGRIGKEINYLPRYMLADMNLGQSYLSANQPDTALFYEKRAEQTTLQSGFQKYDGTIDLLMGDIYKALGDQSNSLFYYYKGLQSATEQHNNSTLSRIYLRLTKYHLASANKDSALYYAKKNLQTIRLLGLVTGLESNIGVAYENLYLSYNLNHQFDSAFKYQSLALTANDSLNRLMNNNLTEFHNLTFNEQLRLQNIEKEKTAYQNKVRTYALLIGIAVFLIIAIILFRNNRRKQKANELLKKQKQEIEEQRKLAEIETSLERVRARTMSMQKPSEFVDVINVIGEQFINLGFEFDWVNFSANGLDVSKAIDIWNFVVVPGLYEGATRLVIPFFDHPVFKKAEESISDYYTTGNEFTVVLLNKKDKDRFLDHLFTNTIYKDLPDEVKTSQYNREVYLTSNVVLKDTWLSLGKYDAKPLTEEQIAILKRLAKAFGQAYTRFLDLQKAEAQARESQIQLALERVRARTMAMQKSNELSEVAVLLFQQAKTLGIISYSSGFTTWDEDDQNLISWMCNADGSINPPFVMPIHEYKWHVQQYESWKKGEAFIVKDFTGEEMQAHYRYLRSFPLLDEAFKKSEAAGITTPERQVHNVANFSHGNLLFITLEPCPEAHQIFKHFANVFEQTYIRFLDIKRAEAQAREAQIEAALERLRSRSMAMHKSNELKEVIRMVLEQFVHLKINVQHAGFYIDYKAHDDMHIWLADPNLEPFFAVLPYFDTPTWNSFIEAKAKGITLHTDLLDFEEKNKFYNSLFQLFTVPEEAKKFYLECEGLAVSTVLLDNVGLYIENFSAIPYTDEENATLMRFGKVFQQTYTRFLDLQKAEIQAREAQIELGLERVRARAMAMQKSDELKELIGIVSAELGKLDIILDRCIFMIYDVKTLGVTWWMANPETPGIPVGLHVKYHELPPYMAFFNAWQERQEKWQYILDGSVKKSWDKFLFEETELTKLPEPVIASMRALSTVYLSASFNNFGCLTVSTTSEPLSNEQFDIMLRFAKVFDLTYTRFNDLKQAEEQARESQIEAALERVRTRTMAMHNSSELIDAAELLFDQVKQLGAELQGVAFAICDKNSNLVQKYTSIGVFSHPYNIEPGEERMYEAWKNQSGLYEEVYEGEKQKKYYEEFMKIPSFRQGLQKIIDSGFPIPTWQKNHAVTFKYGYLLFITTKPFEETGIFLRFGKVFEQTYTRFLDLQKAEAQAREAQIEAALERVRAKAMAMHSSEDVTSATVTMFTELEKLGIENFRCGINYIKADRTQEVWSVTNSNNGKKVIAAGSFDIDSHPFWKLMFDAWLDKKEFLYYYLAGKEKEEYLKILNNTPRYLSHPIKEFPDTHFQVYFYGEGAVWAMTLQPHSEQNKQLIKRFASVFSLTFRRYKDLQKAEAATKEAVKQSALDRIRADIASMRTVKDLDRITPLIWNELTILGVPFIRCGVFIMDDEQQQIHTFLSTPDGKGIAAFHLPYDTQGNISHVISHWQKKEIYTDHWDEKAFKEFANSLVKQGAMKSSQQYLSTMPAGGFNLHFVPFQQGMLYVGNITPLGEEEINLLQSLADAFSTAYARYEDFNKLEAAKKQVDKTLAELKQTQQQLVQSEKMASLGELTAGIAHEIQNPLNFINNFSEVNKELIEEMKEELSKGNFEEVKLIADNISENEVKINHHGKRADGIVKSMLQHSRKTTGQKESIDINALVDEYVRLSYHGLRAKDKSFNAIIETHFDQNVGRISVVGQDMGRVLLNLFNNAFYAVNEKKKNNIDGYEPTVQIVTTKLKNEVIIKVKDNGIGIPEKVLDKIYQPFFTTKPTGEGTGLGLSLSYDIITKGHNGEMKVETKENEGSEFIIRLPVI